MRLHIINPCHYLFDKYILTKSLRYVFYFFPKSEFYRFESHTHLYRMILDLIHKYNIGCYYILECLKQSILIKDEGLVVL